jgi:hypothetical protein
LNLPPPDPPSLLLLPPPATAVLVVAALSNSPPPGKTTWCSPCRTSSCSPGTTNPTLFFPWSAAHCGGRSFSGNPVNPRHQNTGESAKEGVARDTVRTGRNKEDHWRHTCDVAGPSIGSPSGIPALSTLSMLSPPPAAPGESTAPTMLLPPPLEEPRERLRAGSPSLISLEIVCCLARGLCLPSKPPSALLKFADLRSQSFSLQRPERVLSNLVGILLSRIPKLCRRFRTLSISSVLE